MKTTNAILAVVAVLLALNLLVKGTSVAVAQETGGRIGACCFSDGTCIVILDTKCQQGGGGFYGDGSTCADITC